MSASPRPVLYGDKVRWGLIEGDALLTLTKLPSNSIDAICSDPPYGISFADRDWDGKDIRRAVSAQAEWLSDAEAFERWTRVWAAECLRLLKPGGHAVFFGAPRTFHRLVCGVEDGGLEIRDVLLWLYATGVPKSRRMPGGRGTGLKPAYEPILLARAPITGTVTANLKVWGTGALNIGAAAVGSAGYWPANVALSHSAGCSKRGCASDCPAPMVDYARPDLRSTRLFFCAKADRREREVGCERLPARPAALYKGRPERIVRNVHPTVKPIELMRWLVRLITPPGGVVLDPFCGSGSSGAAAMLEDRQFLGIEREPEYVQVARARLEHWARVARKDTR